MVRSVASSRNPPEPIDAHPFYINVNHHFKPHTHAYHELVVIQRGRLRVRLSNAEQISGPGDIILYPVGTVHEEWAEDGEPVLTWVCRFQWKGLGPDDALFCHDAHGRIQESITRLTLEFLKAHFPTRGTPETRLALLQMILDELKRLAAHEPQEMVAQIRAFIFAHIKEPFTLDDLVAISGFSKFHFVRQYRTITGRTPMEDVRFMRAEEARKLIISTSLPLSEIAPQVGISNEFRLSHLLKTVLGVGARDLRHGASGSAHTQADPD